MKSRGPEVLQALARWRCRAQLSSALKGTESLQPYELMCSLPRDAHTDGPASVQSLPLGNAYLRTSGVEGRECQCITASFIALCGMQGSSLPEPVVPEQLHVSLSRTVPIPYAQVQPLVAELREMLRKRNRRASRSRLPETLASEARERLNPDGSRWQLPIMEDTRGAAKAGRRASRPGASKPLHPKGRGSERRCGIGIGKASCPER